MYDGMTRFQVEEYKGIKYVHYDGYYFGKGEYSAGKYIYGETNYIGCIVELSEVLARGFFTCESEYGCECNQYGDNMNEDEIIQLDKELFESGIKVIEEKDITKDIPCGWYACKQTDSGEENE